MCPDQLSWSWETYYPGPVDQSAIVCQHLDLKGNRNETKIFNFTYCAYWAGRLQQVLTIPHGND